MIKNENNNPSDKTPAKPVYKRELVYNHIIWMPFVHISAAYGLYLACGAHRLWSHRSYKANLPLQMILMVFQTLAFLSPAYEWARDHRLHHKHSDTDADPHNSRRGFFFSHIGWLMYRKHPDVREKGKTIDMSDLLADPIVQFQFKHYLVLGAFIWGFIPWYIPHWLWAETLWNSWFVSVMLRYVVSMHSTLLINSAAHMWGMRPYDKSIAPVEANARHFLMGEGFHNYHHSFPMDYSQSELGAIDVFNPATAFIDMFAAIGWAYDLKKASIDVVKSRQTRCGDIHYKSITSRLSEQIVGSFVIFMPIWVITILRMNVFLWPVIGIALYLITCHPNGFSAKNDK
ncbi:unnamed protein product [Medioppia subpectinata]|uniref:Fatty acid desaturase domain-containing protein n=1 Tax=Medioppia subpectinata TaxID=1979941 RepID=A0A7R9Q119_9ACAR|nr:unnamed protein product [Medioppia subpectinata]CAG2108109.1 unnamed protein product [Medioppia subpectinata]